MKKNNKRPWKNKVIRVVDKILGKLGLLRKSKIDGQCLVRGQRLSKRLDEHRELVLLLESEPGFFEKNFWVIGWLSEQDDYLMNLFYAKYGAYPFNENHNKGFRIRTRPKVLNEPNLNFKVEQVY